jgi:hypothetical protein
LTLYRYQAKLIGLEGLLRIIDAAKRDWSQIKYSSFLYFPDFLSSSFSFPSLPFSPLPPLPPPSYPSILLSLFLFLCSPSRFANVMQAGRRLNELNLSITKANEVLGESRVQLLDIQQRPRTKAEEGEESSPKSDIVVGEEGQEVVRRRLDRKSKLLLALVLVYPLLVSLLVLISLTLVVLGTTALLLFGTIFVVSAVVPEKLLIQSMRTNVKN